MYNIPVLNTAIEPLICYGGAFTEEELQKIVDFCDKQQFIEAKVGQDEIGTLKPEVRNSLISWILPSQETDWFYKKIVEIVSTINHDKYQFLLDSIGHLQYTTYTTDGYYKWHVDAAPQPTFGDNQRKLGISIMLSDPEVDFTGGMFQYIAGGNPNQIEGTKIKKGDVLVFPSFIPHQVDTVTSGKRKSLVGWAVGPKFK